MRFQTFVQAIDREPDVVSHRPVVRTLEVKQVNSALNCHRQMITYNHARKQVRKSDVKRELTLYSKTDSPIGAIVLHSSFTEWRGNPSAYSVSD